MGQRFVSLKYYQKKLKKTKLSFRQIERKVFKKGLTPLRFKRNQNTISQHEQFRLFKAHVCIVGCGGLGGNVAELLARIGVGKLTLIDRDSFCEHNLNRQNFSNLNTLHVKKVDVLKENLLLINPALKIHKKPKYLDEKNIDKLLKKAHVVVDCVDDVKTKKLLALWCEKHFKKFVHGAIGGSVLQVSTSAKTKNLYKTNKKGAEEIYGNLAFTASNCASLQASFCINLLLNKNFNFQDLLFCDLKDYEFVNLPL
ncbi:MAG: thiamine biosynthesis protein ThiF [Proteobacteria bacterium]|nr:MAG: thiamine biosynthesis protein ThiF [Pseudomonadota bacterium]